MSSDAAPPAPGIKPGQTLTAAEVFKYAVAAGKAGNLDEAERLYRLLVQAAPIPEAYRNLGLLLERQGRIPEAEATYRAALQARPDDAVAGLNLAYVLLLEGRYAEAWPLYEGRFAKPGASPKPALTLPEWTGQPVRTLALLPEQGMGDQIQFARYAPVLKRQGIDVTLLCPPALARLFGHLGVRVVPTGADVSLAGHDAWAMLASLPLRLGATLENLPSEPYLPGGSGGTGIGLMVRGNPGYVHDARRSLPDNAAAELAALTGGRSLAPEATGAADFEDTRRIIEGLELVISVDTAVAHLAAAMGKPTWLLASAATDWRWLRGRSDSPWYPSLRIFRQPQAGDWASVLAEVKAALAAPQGGAA